ncbi:MAG: hypothetical protein K2X81_26475 [Candidatus Obscuribacterales bacterium]|nr:hypothetical protein [Candidatus Obscuribacterales bacterium]
MRPTFMAVLVAFMILSVEKLDAFAQNQNNSLNSLIKNESNALGGLESDLGPQGLQNLQGTAAQLGDPNLGKEMRQLQTTTPQFSMSGSSLSSAVSAIAGQVRNIPGIGPMLASFCKPAAQQAPNAAQFRTARVMSRLRSRTNVANTLTSSSAGGILGDINQISSLCGAGSLTQNAASNSELSQAGQVMPAAIQNMEQENQDINQLLKE